MRIKKSFLLLALTLIGMYFFSVQAQCPGLYEIELQVDPEDCENDELILTMEYLVNNEDSVKVYHQGSPLSNIGSGPTFEIFRIPSQFDSLTIIGYPSLCEISWIKAEWMGAFSAGFELIDTSQCIYQSDHLLTVNPSGGWIDPNSSYSVSLIQPNGTISMGDTFQVADGIYILEFVDEYGCIHHDSLDISPGLTIVGEFTVNVTPSECSNATGAASINFINMQPPFSFDWRDENGVSFSQEAEVDQLAPGKYYIEIFDAECGSIDSFYIEDDIRFDLVTALQPCVLDTNYWAVAILETGGGPYSYIWTDDAGQIVGTEESATIYGYGDFSVEVSSPNCITSRDFTNSSPLTVDIIGNFITCNDSTTCIEAIVTGAVAPYSFMWSNGVSDVSQLCDLSEGTYSVTVVDVNGCTLETSFSVQVADQLFLNILSFPTSCAASDDGYLNTTISGGVPPYIFTWSNSSTNSSIENALAGIYSLTITDVNGCEVEGSETVEVGTMINYIDTYCASSSGNGSIILFENNPYANVQYDWSNGTSTSVPYIQNLTSGSYSVTVTSANSLCEEIYEDIFVCDEGFTETNNYQICQGDSLEFNITNSVVWTFESWNNPNFNGVDCDDCYDIWVQPDTPMTYTAVYTNSSDEVYFENFVVDVFEDCVYPGDVDTNMVVDHFDLLPLAISLDSLGPARAEMGINFHGHMATDWSNSMQGFEGNQKHADCDGDGIVAYLDTLAIVQNWGETYSRSSQSTSVLVDGVPVFLNMDTIPGTGIGISLPLIVGVLDSMADEIYGMAFSVNFDPEIVVDGSAEFKPIDSWMSDGIDQYILVQKEFATAGRLDVAFCRTNGMNSSGFGQVADFIIIMEDDILLNRSAADLEVEFSISNVKMINFLGEEIVASPRVTEVLVIDRSLSTSSYDLSHMITIFPNPAEKGSSVQVKTDLELSSFELLSIDGKKIYADQFNGSKVISFRSDLTSGMYFLKCWTKDGYQVIKKVILK